MKWNSEPFLLRYLALLEPAVHRMGAPTGWLGSYLDLWPKILRGSCLILRAMWIQASLWAVYLPVDSPNFLCGIS